MNDGNLTNYNKNKLYSNECYTNYVIGKNIYQEKSIVIFEHQIMTGGLSQLKDSLFADRVNDDYLY
ncbi:MAG: hypothetical protein U0X86_001120 [Wolbachia endosymbiont of Xenopsylla cheopis]